MVICGRRRCTGCSICRILWGVSNFLSGDDALDAMLVDPAGIDLMIIPAGPMPPNAAELLSGPRLQLMIDRLLEKIRSCGRGFAACPWSRRCAVDFEPLRGRDLRGSSARGTCKSRPRGNSTPACFQRGHSWCRADQV